VYSSACANTSRADAGRGMMCNGDQDLVPTSGEGTRLGRERLSRPEPESCHSIVGAVIPLVSDQPFGEDKSTSSHRSLVVRRTSLPNRATRGAQPHGLRTHWS